MRQPFGHGIIKRGSAAITPVKSLYAPQNHQNHDPHQHQAQTTRREIAPLAAVSPAWESSYQRQNQKNNQDRSEHCFLLLSGGRACGKTLKLSSRRRLLPEGSAFSLIFARKTVLSPAFAGSGSHPLHLFRNL